MGIITEEQVARVRAAYDEIHAVEKEIKEATGDSVTVRLYWYRSGPIEVCIHDADLVPADVQPTRDCGSTVRWQWEENGARLERRVKMEDYLNEIGALKALPEKSNRC